MHTEITEPAARPYCATEDETILQAIRILESRLRNPGEALSSPSHTRNFLRLELAQEEREVFCVLFLDHQHRLIRFERMFTGTLSQTSVYPREVVKMALALNAAAVMLAHNHPSGTPEPSRADEHVTLMLKNALALVEVRVLDHFVVGARDVVSFAERGLL